MRALIISVLIAVVSVAVSAQSVPESKQEMGLQFKIVSYEPNFEDIDSFVSQLPVASLENGGGMENAFGVGFSRKNGFFADATVWWANEKKISVDGYSRSSHCNLFSDIETVIIGKQKRATIDGSKSFLIGVGIGLNRFNLNVDYEDTVYLTTTNFERSGVWSYQRTTMKSFDQLFPVIALKISVDEVIDNFGIEFSYVFSKNSYRIENHSSYLSESGATSETVTYEDKEMDFSGWRTAITYKFL